MADLKQREKKMQDRRKNTPRRDFLKEICSWRSLVFYKIDGFISRFPETDRIGKIVSHKVFAEQRDNLTSYGLAYNDSETFFTQLQKLFTSVPLENTLLFGNCENSDYADQSMDVKNTYLSYSIIGSENVLYTILTNGGCNIFSSVSVVKSENIYQSHSIVNSYNIFYSKQIDNSRDIRFCTNMVGCQECLFCKNLDNTSYCIHNVQYPKEAYLVEKNKILSQKNVFAASFAKLSPSATISISENVTGNYITDCTDVENGYYIQATHQSRNVIFVAGGEGCTMLHDTYAVAGEPGGYNYYGIMGCTGGDNVYSSVIIPRCKNTYYSYGMESCSYCLGCVGLKNKSFCILNKQYTKEEWFEVANKIFAQMDKDGTLGAFLPGWMNPFYFNDTIACLIDETFTKEEVTKEGYLRRDEEVKTDIPDGAEIIKTKGLTQYQGFDPAKDGAGAPGERKINPEILKKVIVDAQGNHYRIVKMEYDFLVKYGLPLPELHWLERIKLGFKFK